MRTALVFKSHSLGGSSIASLQVIKDCTVAFSHAGLATRWAMAHFLVKQANAVRQKLQIVCAFSKVVATTVRIDLTNGTKQLLTGDDCRRRIQLGYFLSVSSRTGTL